MDNYDEKVNERRRAAREAEHAVVTEAVANHPDDPTASDWKPACEHVWDWLPITGFHPVCRLCNYRPCGP